MTDACWRLGPPFPLHPQTHYVATKVIKRYPSTLFPPPAAPTQPHTPRKPHTKMKRIQPCPRLATRAIAHLQRNCHRAPPSNSPTPKCPHGQEQRGSAKTRRCPHAALPYTGRTRPSPLRAARCVRHVVPHRLRAVQEASEAASGHSTGTGTRQYSSRNNQGIVANQHGQPMRCVLYNVPDQQQPQHTQGGLPPIRQPSIVREKPMCRRNLPTLYVTHGPHHSKYLSSSVHSAFKAPRGHASLQLPISRSHRSH